MFTEASHGLQKHHMQFLRELVSGTRISRQSVNLVPDREFAGSIAVSRRPPVEELASSSIAASQSRACSDARTARNRNSDRHIVGHIATRRADQNFVSSSKTVNTAQSTIHEKYCAEFDDQNDTLVPMITANTELLMLAGSVGSLPSGVSML
jgi:hypothetical protein